MPYTIPSSVISPGAVYQPRQIRQIPAVVSQNARALYYTRSGSISDSLLLDQSPLNSGTRRTGEEGRCYIYDGVDDYSTLDAGFTASGDFTLSFNINATSFASPFHVFIASTSDRIYFNNGISFNIIANGTLSIFTLDKTLVAGAWYNILVRRVSGTITVYVDGVAQSDTEANAQDLDFLYLSSLTVGLNANIFDVRYFNSAITDSQLNYVVSFGKTGTPVTPTNWWKCDEQSGTVGYDSVGGNHLTHTNITAGTFHSTQDIWSFQNQLGFNTSGAVYIPRDESDPTNDVLGNPLTNTGRRPNDAALHSSNCLTADGTLYIAAAHLAGTETVVSFGGTSTPSISAGRIDFTAGTCWDLTLSDGTHYPLSEGGGIGIHDDSGAENHGILTNAVLANAWGGSQDSYHSNLSDGFVYAYQPAKQVFTAAQAANITGISFKFRSTDTKFIVFNSSLSGGGNYLIILEQGSSILAPVFSIGTPTINIDGTSYLYSTLTRGELYNLMCDGLIHNIQITNLTFGSSFQTGGINLNSYDTISWIFDSSTYLWDLQATDSNGDPIIPADPDVRLPAVTSSLGPYSMPLTDLPSNSYRNRAETLIDLDPDSTPEMGASQLGITVPASHAFGDVFAASTQIFSRQRTLTEDRFVVMPEAQTGSALATIQKYTQP